MNNVWLMILGVMVVGSLIKYIFLNQFIAVAINFAVLGAIYMILKRYPVMDMKKSMIVLGGMTVIISLVDLGIIRGYMGNIGLLILIAMMFFKQGGGSNRPPRQRHQWHK